MRRQPHPRLQSRALPLPSPVLAYSRPLAVVSAQSRAQSHAHARTRDCAWCSDGNGGKRQVPSQVLVSRGVSAAHRLLAPRHTGKWCRSSDWRIKASIPRTRCERWSGWAGCLIAHAHNQQGDVLYIYERWSCCTGVFEGACAQSSPGRWLACTLESERKSEEGMCVWGGGDQHRCAHLSAGICSGVCSV